MAFYDDKRWLLKHIRHSFITGDESQLCEHVLLNNDFPLPKATCDSDDDQVISDDDVSTALAESPDIFVGSGLHRPRTFTAIRLEKMKKDREETEGVKHIVWAAPKEESAIPAEELDYMFAKKPVKPPKTTSRLTELLKQSPALPPNPFTAYARFDGVNCFAELPAKRIKIFFSMIPYPARSIPVEVGIVPNARVSDLIGLACWQYTSQNREPRLPHDKVDGYKLLFSEEDGEFDFDFPCLEKNEIISKFHFTSLALVERSAKAATFATSMLGMDPSESSSRYSTTTSRPGYAAVARMVILPSREVVNVVLPNGGADITVSDLLRLTEAQCQSEQMANRLRAKTFVVKDKADPTNSILSLSTKVTDCRSREFILAPSETRAEEIRMRKHLSVMEAALYESFNVSLIQRFRASSEIHLGISGEKVEVNPVASKGHSLGLGIGLIPVPAAVKPVTYDMDTIADCSIVDEKYGKKAVVRLVYKAPSGEYKNLDFECIHDTARTIDQKCKHILNLRSSMVRQEYLELEAGKKPGKRWFSDSSK